MFCDSHEAITFSLTSEYSPWKYTIMFHGIFNDYLYYKVLSLTALLLIMIIFWGLIAFHLISVKTLKSSTMHLSGI